VARARLAVGLLGGSFNPAHEGHLHISVEALRRLQLDWVWWLVAPQNPLKPVQGMAPLAERLAGARRLARHPRIRVTDIEARLGTRYTVDTIAALQRRFPTYDFVWLMGADNLVQFPAWSRWTAIAEAVPIAVFARPTYVFRALSGKASRRFARYRRGPQNLARARPPAWTFLAIRPHPASATAIRRQGATAEGGGRRRVGQTT
jgi:nicotinate-nucleotide adenylyltransferase